jgi:protein-L-isoaspartate(D-aspartate) O-methyltransferase
MNSIEIARFNMIEQQVRPWEVLDHQVLATLQRINREDFVDPAYRGLAYADCQIPLANGARMLPPTIEGRMLQALLLNADDTVLVVGCGSGYIGACIGNLASQVKCIDADAELVELATANLDRAQKGSIEVVQASLGDFDEASSYDAIAVTGSVATVPHNLKLALKPGGRMFVIAGHSPAMQALLITRIDDSEWTTESLFETDLPRLRA